MSSVAATDPNGQPTTGIERIQTSHGPFGMNSDVHTHLLAEQMAGQMMTTSIFGYVISKMDY